MGFAPVDCWLSELLIDLQPQFDLIHNAKAWVARALEKAFSHPSDQWEDGFSDHHQIKKSELTAKFHPSQRLADFHPQDIFFCTVSEVMGKPPPPPSWAKEPSDIKVKRLPPKTVSLGNTQKQQRTAAFLKL